MKSRVRNFARPVKAVVSDETLARARGALKAFGLEAIALDQLENFKGDVTTGPAAAKIGRAARKKP